MGGAVLMITITDRNRGETFANWYQSQGIPLVMTALGNGTATTEILDYLGLEATEKAVLFCGSTFSTFGTAGCKGFVAGCSGQRCFDDCSYIQHGRFCERISVAGAGSGGNHGE